MLNDTVMGFLLHLQLLFFALSDAVADHKGEDDDDTDHEDEDAASCHDGRQNDQHVQGPRHALRQLGDGLES